MSNALPRRILLLDTGKEWGGGTNSMIELLKRVDRRRYHVTALFYVNYSKGSVSNIQAELGALGIECQILQPVPMPWWAKALKELGRGLFGWQPRLRRHLVFTVDSAWRIRPSATRLAAVLRQGNYDLLYMNNQPSSNLEGYLAAETCGLPVIQHCRIAARISRTEAETANRVASRIICVSEGVAETMVAQGISRHLCVVVPNGIDTAQPLPDGTAARNAWGMDHGQFVVGAVGSLIERKGIDCLIQAFASAARRYASVRLVLVGEGPLRHKLEELTRQLGVTDRVTFTGFQASPMACIAGMDAVVLASSREGLPRVLLEAMLLQKPIIATDIPGTRELVIDGVTGRLFPHGDTAALTRCISELIETPGLAQRLGQAGSAHVRDHYSIEQYVAGVERVWQEAIQP